ncbi:MAG: hypothetical protein V1755_05655 [Chloroflexota bacterium]
MTPEAIAAPANLAELLRDKIQKEFVSLISPEQWDTMLQREWDAFFLPGRNAYRGETTPSKLSELIKAEVERGVKEHLLPLIAQRLEGLAWEHMATEATSQIISECSGKVMGAFVERLMATLAMEIQVRMPQRPF